METELGIKEKTGPNRVKWSGQRQKTHSERMKSKDKRKVNVKIS